MGEAREVMDRITEASLTGDRAAVMACYAEDAVAVTPELGELRGREAIADYVLGLNEAFSDLGYESTGKYEDGNTAIDEGYVTGTHTGPMRLPSGDSIEPTGRRVRLRGCDIAHVEGGVVTRHNFYNDQVEFMEQLGLSEQQQ